MLPAAPLPRRAVLGCAAAACVVLVRGAAAADPAELSFATLYAPVTAAGVELTAQARALVGGVVAMRGFMAPPLKAESGFFVLTRYPMSDCPFCSSAADWPVDIVFVRLGRSSAPVSPSHAIVVSGVLEAGLQVDPGTGFVSLVRVVEASWRAA